MYGALVNDSDGKTEVLKENSVPVLFGPPQIPHTTDL
jgi:hypothetical protein